METEVQKYSRITPQLKAEIIASLISGVGVCEIARQTQISKAAVSKIKTQLEENQKQLLPENLKFNIDEMLLESLKVHLEGLHEIALIAKDKEYVRNQKASDLAQLHDRLSTFAISLLEAAEGNPNN